MSKYYTAQRTSGLFLPSATRPFRLSRSKIDLFLECPQCFYFDRRLGVGRPPGFPFTLNSAVDQLLKKEFDIHRAKGSKHPLQAHYGIDAVPFLHPKMDEWRDSLRGGITYIHTPTNFLVSGGIDDLWVNPSGQLIIVDYKATAKESEISLNADWQIGYKRQMEVYQWLFRKNGFDVSSTGYFVYCNGRTDRKAFDGKLEFDVHILPYTGDDTWIEKTLLNAHECLSSPVIPAPSSECDFCQYRTSIARAENVSLASKRV